MTVRGEMVPQAPGVYATTSYFHYISEPTGTIDAARRFDAIAANAEAQASREGRARRFLIDLRGVESVDGDARHHFYRRDDLLANWWIAIVGRSYFHKTLVNFLVMLTPHKGVRYFRDFAAAESWLVDKPSEGMAGA